MIWFGQNVSRARGQDGLFQEWGERTPQQLKIQVQHTKIEEKKKELIFQIINIIFYI